ncbi:MAG: nitrate reductase subunit beta, partial [Acidimicrobiales bacterium]
LYQAQLSCFLDPEDPAVRAEAEAAGIPHDWVQAARRSPAYALIARHQVALPLHPEYRTMPMVWYVPPLSPVADVTTAAGYDEADPDAVFATIDALRIPIEYLANLFSAGKVAPVRDALRRLAAVRALMRARQLGTEARVDPASVGMSAGQVEDLFRLLAIARYEDRYVVPPAHAEEAGRLMAQHSLSGCSLESEGGPGMGGWGIPEEAVPGFHLRGRHPEPVASRGGDGKTHLRVVESGPDGGASR